jgi:hypothetical protein
LNAQSIVCTGGGDIQSVNGEISFTIGTIDFASIESSEFEIKGGIQQPFEWFTAGVKINNHIIGINYYPNPVIEFLYLEFRNTERAEITIYNQLGQNCHRCQIFKGKNQINLSQLPKGVYQIQFNNERYQSFKFIKS